MKEVNEIKFKQTPIHHAHARCFSEFSSHLLTILPHIEGTHITKKIQGLTLIIISLIRLFSSSPECIETPLCWSIILWNIRSNLLTISIRSISHFVSMLSTSKATPGTPYTLTIMPLSTSDICRFDILRTPSFLKFTLGGLGPPWVWILFLNLYWPWSLVHSFSCF